MWDNTIHKENKNIGNIPKNAWIHPQRTFSHVFHAHGDGHSGYEDFGSLHLKTRSIGNLSQLYSSVILLRYLNRLRRLEMWKYIMIKWFFTWSFVFILAWVLILIFHTDLVIENAKEEKENLTVATLMESIDRCTAECLHTLGIIWLKHLKWKYQSRYGVMNVLHA